MEIRDLRIGNLIRTPSGTAYVTGIGTKDGNSYIRFRQSHADEESNVGYYLDVCEGIPLTDDHFSGIGGIEPRRTSTGRYDISYCGVYLTALQHLHEWQNLYYAIWGVELKIKPTQI